MGKFILYYFFWTPPKCEQMTLVYLKQHFFKKFAPQLHPSVLTELIQKLFEWHTLWAQKSAVYFVIKSF